ncbi:hypothetical protein ACMCNP_07885 [Candidatus Acidulodesulfobacterium sp. H_13]|uniref:hypothetical protein n=1 Tax=Candidatus Acidulodesulfobacterium sp. H_13 TaxID=3395470 RepID=UPI003AF9D225
MSKRFVVKQFLNVHEIIVFAIVVCVILVLFFPEKELVSIMIKYPGYIPPKYINAVIKANPSENLKIALVRHYINSGHYDKAENALKNINSDFKQINFFDYAGLKYKLLTERFFIAGSSRERWIIKNKIKTLLSMLIMAGHNEYRKYLHSSGKKWTVWLLDGYKFELAVGDNRLALGLLNHYLKAYPEYREKYLKNLAVLYAVTGENRKAYESVNSYIKTHVNYRTNAALFKTVIEKAILERNKELTMLLLKIYGEKFSKDLRMEKFILIYALQSGNPYFARDIAIELSKENR